jgi:hypothetical protein
LWKDGRYRYGKDGGKEIQLQTARETRSALLRRRVKKGRSALLFLTAPFSSFFFFCFAIV